MPRATAGVGTSVCCLPINQCKRNRLPYKASGKQHAYQSWLSRTGQVVWLNVFWDSPWRSTDVGTLPYPLRLPNGLYPCKITQGLESEPAFMCLTSIMPTISCSLAITSGIFNTYLKQLIATLDRHINMSKTKAILALISDEQRVTLGSEPLEDVD